MLIRNVSRQDLEEAMARTTRMYDQNIKFLKLVPREVGWIVRLTVCDSGCPGARVGDNGRKIKAACWHAHGNFFEHLLNVNQDAIIECGKIKIDQYGGNWEDMNIGSINKPRYYSEACLCMGAL